MNILFYDCFDGTETLPDTTVWQLCTYANNTWSQYFKDVESFENVRVDEGYLTKMVESELDLVSKITLV